MQVAVINFVDEDFEGQVGELANPFRVVEGQVQVEKDPGGPLSLIVMGEDGVLAMRDVPKTSVLGITVYDV